MIVVLTEDGDPHADRVGVLLDRRGADWFRLDESWFPAKASFAVSLFPNGAREVSLTARGRTIDLETVSVVWRRRPFFPVAPPEVTNPDVRVYVEAECRRCMRALWTSLGCVWVPGLVETIERADYKASQLQIAASVGFELPPTLITNDPDEFLRFYRAHDGNIVSKLASTTLLTTMAAQKLYRYTERVTWRDVGYADTIRYAPAVFQAYIAKRVELRITVVGERVFAAEIHSQTTSRTSVDWRHYDMGHTPHFIHELPATVRDQCLALVRALGLRFGAIDMIITPEGRYVFIEINPNGQYLWIEEITGLPISEAVADLLVSCDSQRPRDHAQSTLESTA